MAEIEVADVPLMVIEKTPESRIRITNNIACSATKLESVAIIVDFRNQVFVLDSLYLMPVDEAINSKVTALAIPQRSWWRKLRVRVARWILPRTAPFDDTPQAEMTQHRISSENVS